MDTAKRKLPLQRRSARPAAVMGIALMFIILSLGLVLLGCDRQEAAQEGAGKNGPAGTAASTASGKNEAEAPAEPPTSFKVYFSDTAGMKLVGEVRVLPDATRAPAALVQALIDGPTAPNQPTLPAGTRLLGVAVEKGTAAIDLSQEFVDNHPGGSSSERISVYSIVNTLTELPEIDQVTILVNGKSIETIGGHLDVSGPLVRDGGLL